MNVRFAPAVLLLGILAASNGHAQPPLDPRPKIPPLVTALSPLLLPKVIGDCWLLKEYLRSDEFAGVRHAYGDLYAVDVVYDRALRLAWNNTYEALLITAFATMDHRRVGIRVPMLGSLLWFPLSSEFQEDFDARVNALPSRLYFDTPDDRAGDRDKLQHFFGSAFLAYTLESDDAPGRIGDFIEWGEERFIVGGVNDERDQRANFQGRTFGLRLLGDDSVWPSDYLVPVYVFHPAESGCVPGPVAFETEER
jgi:hypothetical protein